MATLLVEFMDSFEKSFHVLRLAFHLLADSGDDLPVDFRMAGHTYAVGDIQFTWDEFECPNCQKHLTVNEMKEIEGIPLPKKPSKWHKILFYVFGILFLIAVALLKKYL